MQFMLKPGEADLKDNPAKAPDIVPAEWADRVLADIIRDVRSGDSNPPPRAEPATAAVPSRETAAPPRQPSAIAASNVSSLDAALRTADLHPVAPPARRWGQRMMIGFALAMCGAGVTAAWPHYSDTAWQTIVTWTPRLLATSTAPVNAAEQPSSLDTQAAISATAPAQPAAAEAAVSVQPSPGETTPSLPPDAAQALQSMARDMAAMAQQVEQLRAGMAELKTGQQQMARDMAKTSDIKTSDIKASEAKASETRISDIKASASTPEPRPCDAGIAAEAAEGDDAEADLAHASRRRHSLALRASPDHWLRPDPMCRPSAVAATASASPPPTARAARRRPVVRPPMPLRGSPSRPRGQGWQASGSRPKKSEQKSRLRVGAQKSEHFDGPEQSFGSNNALRQMRKAHDLRRRCLRSHRTAVHRVAMIRK